MRTVLLILMVSVLIATTAAQAADAGPIVYRVTEAPEFFDPTDECPEGGGVATMRTGAGLELGTSRLCLQAVDFTCEPVCVQRQFGALTNTFAGGQIFINVVFRDVFNKDFSHARHFARGSVAGGTGAYAGSTGYLQGRGSIELDPDFTPHPNLTYRVFLR